MFQVRRMRLEFHDVANIFPMMVGEDYCLLRDDIKMHGLLEPIILFEGKILDGRNRYTACLDLGIEPAYIEWHENGSNPLDYVISKNLHRRHLNESQRAVIAAKLANIELGDNQYRGSANLPTQITQQQAAQMLNVSERSIQTIKSIEREAPELLLKIEAGEMTAHEAEREEKKKQRAADIEKQKEEILANNYQPPIGLFDVIVIDPPWPYGTDSYDPNGRRCANPYPEMSIDEIKAINIPASVDCILWLWTTHKFMRYSFELLNNWGFRDVAILTWVKDRMGTGSWLRSQSEFCIMAVKGNPKVNLTNQTTVIQGSMREHSRKPDEFYKMVEGLCPGYKIDYFSREKREGWAQFGNDVDKF